MSISYNLLKRYKCPQCHTDEVIFLREEYNMDEKNELIYLFYRIECNCGWKGYLLRFSPFDLTNYSFFEHEEDNVEFFHNKLISKMRFPIVKKCPSCKREFKLDDKYKHKTNESIIYGVKCEYCGWTGMLQYNSKYWGIANILLKNWKKEFETKGSQKLVRNLFKKV